MTTHPVLRALLLWSVLTGGVFSSLAAAEEPDDLKQQVELLKRTNAALAEQIQKQQSAIESLTQKVEDIQQRSSQQSQTLEDLKTETMNKMPSMGGDGHQFGKIHLSGEAGVGFFNTGSKGMFPNAEFRVDEAKLFIDAPVWESVYTFAEINLAQHESSDLDLRLGEFYVDFENVSRLWDRERMLNIRVGRMDVPFGEEYLTRDAIDNPLISHSLSDFWGVDEGLELYGRLGPVSYVLAVQNGGASQMRDYNADKSVTARVGWDPAKWLHLSVSGMRTGDLDANDDYLSEVWFGGGWFRSIGSTNTTTFHADVVQADVAIRWERGHLKAFGGYALYDDNDPSGNNRRDIYYYSVEGLQRFTRRFYAAARFSQILANDGYPINGNAMMDDYFFGPLQTENLWRLSLGLGYQLNDRLVVKGEYSFEQGRLVGGADRNDQDQLALEVAVKF